jgi:cell division protease FtsH
MTTYQLPQQPPNGDEQWHWESEETLVDRRNRMPNRIRRFIMGGWRWAIGLFAIFFTIALLDPAVMNAFVQVASFLLQLAIRGAVVIFQFVFLFGFLARSRMYTIMPGAEGVSFADYRGQPELLEQAKEIVTLLRGVRAFENAGGEPLNGLLLEGPPGTGKTWLAQAISTEAGVPFYYVDTSSLQGTFIGTGQLKINRLYGRARKAARQYGAAVIFMDEIDSIGTRGGVSRVGGGSGGDDDGGMGGMGGGMGLLNTLLIQMSGFSLEHGWRARLRTWFYKTILRRKPPKIEKRLLTIGATNRAQALDPALLRPGRFDKKLRVDAPDTEGRRDILEYYLSKMAHDETLDPVLLATETPGYTPSDIKYLLNESLRYALFAGRRYITYRDFLLAQPEHERGLRAPLKHMAPEARRRLAYYQAGRAVAVRLFLPEHRIARITIVRQGESLGHIAHYPAREVYPGMLIKDQLLSRLCVSVAGKAAEIEFCGAANQTTLVLMGDLDRPGEMQNIYERLSMMVGAGMFSSMGGAMDMMLDIRQGRVGPQMTPGQARDMEEAYQQVLQKTRLALRENAHIVEALVELLLEKEELLGHDATEFFDKYGLYTPEVMITVPEEELRAISEPLPELIGIQQSQNRK